MQATAATNRDMADLDDTRIRASIRAAEHADAEPPRPLRRPLRDPEPYPIDALGPVISSAVRAAHSIIQAPVEICAQSALSHAALATQAHANVQLPIGQTKPLSLFLLSVAATGERKSAVDKELGWALERHERNLSTDLADAKANYQNDKEAFEAARSAAKAKAKDGKRDDISTALNSVGLPPDPPLDAVVSFPEPTLEGLHKHLAIGQPSMGLFSDEGGMFVGGVGMTRERALMTAAGFSQLWDGSPVKRLRSMDGATVLFGRRVSLHLMLQPNAATSWLADETLRDQGLFSRILIAAPLSLAGTRFHRRPEPGAQESIHRFGARVLQCFERPARMAEGKTGELDPRALPMSPEAEEMWWAFTDHIEGKLSETGPLRPVMGLANKIPEHAARIAGVLALFDDLDADGIDEAALSRGIKLASWYLGEALRLAEAGHVPDDVRLAEAALKWLHESWPMVAGVTDKGRLFSPADLYQFGPGSIRHKEIAGRAIQVLIDHGWVLKVDGRHKVRGMPRNEVYSVKGLG